MTNNPGNQHFDDCANRMLVNSSDTLPNPSVPPEPITAIEQRACPSEQAAVAFLRGELAPNDARRVQRHVEACARCQQLIDDIRRRLSVASELRTERSFGDTVFRPNDVIGERYLIRRLVGRGSIGEVYEAFDTELNERIAIKTLMRSAMDETRAARTLRGEVLLARRISHPNICPIYDFDRQVSKSNGQSTYFLAMEFIEGECLGQHVRHWGPLPISEALSLARQLLRGLRAAHNAGVFHGDLKSHNIMLRARGAQSATAVILDFGLSRGLKNPQCTAQRVPMTTGTLQQVSPEQLEGRSFAGDTDIYSFGMVWYEMLTARLPFEVDSSSATGLARLHHAPDPPSQFNPSVPAWQDGIILRCLARNQSQCFSTADDVLLAIEHASPNPDQQVRRWSRSVGAPGALLSGVCVLIAFTLSRPTHPHASTIPVQHFHQFAQRSMQMRVALKDRFAGVHVIGWANEGLPQLSRDAPDSRSHKTGVQAQSSPSTQSERSPNDAAVDDSRSPLRGADLRSSARPSFEDFDWLPP